MEVKILRESEFTTYPRPGEAVVVVAITYQADMRAPRTIWVDKDKLTDETRKDAIRADMAKWQLEKPRTLEL